MSLKQWSSYPLALVSFCVCKRFIRIGCYQVGCSNSGIGEVATKTGVEDGENGAFGGINDCLR